MDGHLIYLILVFKSYKSIIEFSSLLIIIIGIFIICFLLAVIFTVHESEQRQLKAIISSYQNRIMLVRKNVVLNDSKIFIYDDLGRRISNNYGVMIDSLTSFQISSKKDYGWNTQLGQLIDFAKNSRLTLIVHRIIQKKFEQGFK